MSTRIGEQSTNLPWNSGNLSGLFEKCAEQGEFGLIDSAVGRMSRQVPEGEYASRHRGMLHRTAADSVKKHSLSKAVEYYKAAAKVDKGNTAVLMGLGKLHRRAAQLREARDVFNRVLKVNPSHRGAQRELEKLDQG